MDLDVDETHPPFVVDHEHLPRRISFTLSCTTYRDLSRDGETYRALRWVSRALVFAPGSNVSLFVRSKAQVLEDAVGVRSSVPGESYMSEGHVKPRVCSRLPESRWAYIASPCRCLRLTEAGLAVLRCCILIQTIVGSILVLIRLVLTHRTKD